MNTVTARLSVAIFFCVFCLAADIAAADDVLDEIVVRADFRGRAASELPASVTVLDAAEVEGLALQHFEELINVIPNFNWSGDGHRARYFQIRGVGELEQYQGAPNPSVGFLIDDIDFSGIGTIATLFDIERVEVLRGPQGTRYGANALAGLVYVQSTMPAAEQAGRLQVMAGGDDMWSLGLAGGGTLGADERMLYRASAHHYRSNGFRDNRYLDRDDTNGRKETTLRGRLSIDASDSLAIDVAAMFSDIDDGYDAFALDNSYTMLSDKPGRDAQRSVGASAKLAWSGWTGLQLTSITAFADSDIDFSFDADWGNEESWYPVLYDYVTHNQRQRRTLSQELRLASENDGDLDWLVGLYLLRLTDSLDSLNQGEYYDPGYDYADSLYDRLVSDYEANSIAVFGQLEQVLSEVMRLTLGFRAERRATDYSDSSGLSAAPAETMTGGEAALSYDHSSSLTSYFALSRGYKAGGFNLGVVPAGRRDFAQETMWNLEAGIKSWLLDDRLQLNLSVFYTRRDDQQVRTSFQQLPGDPSSFVFYTDNAAAGESHGLEADLRWTLDERWELYANLGLLDATFADFVTPEVDLTGRAQAHAPRYTYAAGGTWRSSTGWFLRADVAGKDDFYFDVSNNQKSEPYNIVNLRIGYESANWTTQIWVRNVFDEYYAVRGFYFGNEPPDFPPTLYTRAGDPRQVGISFDRRF